MSSRAGPDLGYFVRMPVRRQKPQAAGPVEDLPLVRGSGPRLNRTKAVLIALAGVAGGALLYGVIMLFSMFFSFWGSDTGNDHVFALGLGACVALGSLVVAWLIWRDWSVRPVMRVTEDAIVVRYSGFRRPFVVPRPAVRVATTDDSPGKAFRNNKRFPVSGLVPEDAFADALDQFHRPPWEPREAEIPRQGTGPTVPSDGWPQGPAGEEGAPGYLFGDGGTALHVLRVNPEDIPNVAVLFHDPLPTPAAPIGFMISGHCGMFPGGRRIRGFLARVESPERAAAAFARWGVLRAVTAQDVLEEGLRLPKPLKGWRVAGYAAVILVPLAIKIFRRILT